MGYSTKLWFDGLRPGIGKIRAVIFRRRYQRLLVGVSTLLLLVGLQLPGLALPSTLLQIPGGNSSSGNSVGLGWVELDGYDAFQVSAPKAALAQRIQDVSQNLQEIRDHYLGLTPPAADVFTQESEEGQPEVYVNGQYLMTVTQSDANLQGTTPSGIVKQMQESLPRILSQARDERQPEYRRKQFWIIGIMLGLALVAMALLHHFSKRLLHCAVGFLGASLNQEEMTPNQRHQLQDLRNRLLPLLQGFILASTLVWAMGRFPETRVTQQAWLSALKIPIVVLIVIVVAYAGVRLTYAVVDRLLLDMTDEEGFSSNYSRRARLRISTLSSVIKNIANFIWITVGFVVALTVTGVDIGLLLASVGIIGLAISLAAQNLVQGAIRGFFIVLEDQFAIGDVVKIGEDAGIVENLNLRITQLRDAGGRLITIPTSDINRVANYSLHWSRSDLKIPVHYKADIDQMLDLTRQVGADMQQHPEWGQLILEDPQILGVDDFDESAMIIRVWIKTQPLKQWDVSREYRRRFRLALEDMDTSIPFPQQDVWLHPAEEFWIKLQGKEGLDLQKSAENGHSNGHHDSSNTDRQPRTVPDAEGEPDAD